MTTLRYLVFDICHDDEGGASLDASASVTEARWPALLAEVDRVLGWAERQFPGQRGPAEEGGLWDVDVQGSEEFSRPLQLEWLPAAGPQGGLRWASSPQGQALCRRTLHVSLRGGAVFLEAFEAAFDWAA